MGNCACCHKVRPRYKEYVRDIYPKNAKYSDPGKPVINFRPLIQYAASYPNNLPKLARYLAKQIKRDLQLRDAGDVRIGCEAFLALMDACHSDHAGLSLYDQYVREIIKLLFEDKNAEFKILGCDLFNKFISFHDQRSEYNKLKPFFKYLVELCTYRKRRMRLEVRMAGMESMIKMVQLNQDRNTVEYLDEIIPAVLDNFEMEPKKEEKKHQDEKGVGIEEKQKSMDELSRDCLEHIARLATLPYLTKVVNPLFDYLDEREWLPLELSISSLKSVVDHANIQNANYFLSLLPIRIDTWSKRGDQCIPIMTRIVETTRELVLTMRLDVGNGSYLVQSLIKQLIDSVQEDEDHFEIALTQCIGAYLYRIQNFGDSVETIKEIIDETPNCDQRQTRSLLRAACHAARLRPAFHISSSMPNGYPIPESIIKTLAHLLGESKDMDVKILVNGVLQNLLLPTYLLQDDDHLRADAICHSEESQKMYVFLNRINDSNNPLERLPAHLTSIQFSWIKQGIYGTLSESNGNTGETVQACFRTLVVLLHLGDRVDFIYQIPMIFKLQELAVNIRPSSPQHALRLHNFVAAYILFIARMFADHNDSQVRRRAVLLDQKISEIIKQREESDQISPDLVIANDVGLKAILNNQDKLKLKPIDILIDEKEIVGILQQFPVPSVTSGDIRKAMTNKFVPAVPRPSRDTIVDSEKITNLDFYDDSEPPTRHSSSLSQSPTESDRSSFFLNIEGTPQRAPSDISIEEDLDYDTLFKTTLATESREQQDFENFMFKVDSAHAASAQKRKTRIRSPELELLELTHIDPDEAKSGIGYRRLSRSEVSTPPSITVTDTFGLDRRGSTLYLPDPNSDSELDIKPSPQISLDARSSVSGTSSPRPIKNNSSTLELKFPKLSPLDFDDDVGHDSV